MCFRSAIKYERFSTGEGSLPWGLLLRPDRSVWFAGVQSVGFIQHDQVKHMPLNYSRAFLLSEGPDNSVYFTESYTNKIGCVDASGRLSERAFRSVGLEGIAKDQQ